MKSNEIRYELHSSTPLIAAHYKAALTTRSTQEVLAVTLKLSLDPPRM